MSELAIRGVTFRSVRDALVSAFFSPKTKEDFQRFSKFVVPMQHNIDNPIKADTQDTWIQYWINSDDSLTQDYKQGDFDVTAKVASVTLRFLGRRAEVWAKTLHHLTKRKSYSTVFTYYCNGNLLEKVSPITVQNVDYFGVGNTTKAFTVMIKIQYDEILDFSDGNKGTDILEYVNIAEGEMKE